MLFIITGHSSWSQSSLGIGADISAGGKGFMANGRSGLGGSLEYTYMLSRHSVLRLYAGYHWFKQRLPGIDQQSIRDSILRFPELRYNISLIPFRAEYQYFFYQQAAFVYADIGAARRIFYYSSTIYSYAIGTGYWFAFKAPQYLQLSVYYNRNRIDPYRRRNYFSFRAAYGLEFGKKKR